MRDHAAGGAAVILEISELLARSSGSAARRCARRSRGSRCDCVGVATRAATPARSARPVRPDRGPDQLDRRPGIGSAGRRPWATGRPRAVNREPRCASWSDRRERRPRRSTAGHRCSAGGATRVASSLRTSTRGCRASGAGQVSAEQIEGVGPAAALGQALLGRRRLPVEDLTSVELGEAQLGGGQPNSERGRQRVHGELDAGLPCTLPDEARARVQPGGDRSGAAAPRPARPGRWPTRRRRRD